MPRLRRPTIAVEAAEHVVGPFADQVEPRVAHQPLERPVGEEAGPAVDLQRVVDDPPQGVAGKQLDHRRFEHVVLGPRVDEGRRVVGGTFHRVHLGRGERDLLADEVEFAQRLAELPPFVGVFRRFLDAELGHAGAAGAEGRAAEVEDGECEPQPLAVLARGCFPWARTCR